MRAILGSLFVLFRLILAAIVFLFFAYFIAFLILDFINYENIEWRYLLFIDVPVKKLIIGGTVMGVTAWWVKTFGSGSKNN